MLTIGFVEVTTDMRVAAEAVMPDLAAVVAAPLVGGSSAAVAALTLTSADGVQRRVVFRQHPRRTGGKGVSPVASKEFHLTDWLARAGFPVARPLALHGEETCHGPWLVMEWVQGTTEVADGDIDHALSQMADFLVRLHRVDPDHIVAPGLSEIEDPVEALPSYPLDDETRAGVERVLAAGVQRHPNAVVLLHGDLWPGNVMFERGRLVAVLDWEDSARGDPLVDLACARVELACAYGAAASARFTELYFAASTPLDERDLALWDVYVSATALSAMHRWGLSRAEEAARRRTTRWFLDAAIGRMTAT